MNYSKTPLVGPLGIGTQLGRGDCGCHDAQSRIPTLAGESLAIVYSPLQEFDNLYCPEEGLCAGTIFKELEKPFWGAGRL